MNHPPSSPSLTTQQRDALRKTLRQQRQQLSPNKQTKNAHKLVAKLINLAVLKQAQHIAVYLANDGEISLDDVINQLWKMNKKCYLPVLDKSNKGQLVFLQYTKHQSLVSNCFNILEPRYNTKLAKTAQQMDVILMPLVGFDRNCNRIGMGGGYYDKSLSFINTENIKPVLIGIAHSIQCVDQVPIEKWDIKLNKIVTESKVYQGSNS